MFRYLRPSFLRYAHKAGILLLFICLAAIIATTFLFQDHSSNTLDMAEERLVLSAPEEVVSAVVDRVVDGDTIVIEGGERVRLIGIDAPESVHPNESRNSAAGKESAAFLKELLREGMTVYLEYDNERTDDYGRTLAYVWLSLPESDIVTVDTVCESMAQGVLLASGMAEIMTIEPNTCYSTIFEAILEGKTA